MAKQPFENVVHHLFQIAARAEFKTLCDQDLLKRYVEQRDELAFGELVRRYKAMVWYVCWRVLQHHQDVEDAFQATVMTLVRRSKSILGRQTIESWLHRVAYHIATKAKVMRARQHAREERRAKMGEKNYENYVPRCELSEVLDKELTHIPEKYRSPLILCYLDGLSWNEAAQRLGISHESLKWRLEEGRERLKKRLSKYGMEWSPTMLAPGMAAGVHLPEIPHGLVEKTLDMVRIMTLSNGALATAGISPQVAALVKVAMGVWTLKVKICLAVVLLTAAGVGAGVAKYPGFFLNLLGWEPPRENKQEPINSTADETPADPTPPRKDRYGDPLPSGALTRLGSLRFRGSGIIAFTADSKGVGLVKPGERPRWWDMSTGACLDLRKPGLIGKVLKSQPRAGVCLSPDGHWIAGSVGNGNLAVWDTITGNLVREFPVKNNMAVSYVFAPDSKSLVVVGVNNRKVCNVSRWDIAMGDTLWTQARELRGRTELAFSPTGAIVAEGGRDGTSLYDARTGQFLRTLGHPWPVESLAFSPDGHTLAIGYKSRHIKKPKAYMCASVHGWDVATGKERWCLADTVGIGSVCFHHPVFSPDGKLIAIGAAREQDSEVVHLLEAATGKFLRACQKSHNDWEIGNQVADLTFSPDGKLLAGKQWGVLYCWEVASGKLLESPVFGHESVITSVHFTADGYRLVSADYRQGMHVWDAQTGQKQVTLREESRCRKERGYRFYDANSHATVVSQDGKTLVAGMCIDVPDKSSWKTARGSIGLWDAMTGQELRRFPWNASELIGHFNHMVISPDGKFLAVCIAVKETVKGKLVRLRKVVVWEMATGHKRCKIEGARPVFSPDGKLLLTCKKAEVLLWDVATGEKIASVALPEEIDNLMNQTTVIAVSPDWRIMAIGSDRRNARGGREIIHFYPMYRELSGVRIGPSNVAVSAPDAKHQMVICLAFSPDGRLLASVGHDGIVHLWETATGKERLRLVGHSGPVWTLSFAPDGQRLASGGNDLIVLVWDVTGGWLDEHGRLRPTLVSARQAERLWQALASPDAAQASRALWKLVAARSTTVDFLKTRLRVAPNKKKGSAEALAQFMANLDSDVFAVRQQASEQLRELGTVIEPSLRQVLAKGPSAEVRFRVTELLKALEEKHAQPLPAETLRSLRAIEALEHIGGKGACQLLESLSRGDPGARQTQEAQATLSRLRQRQERRYSPGTHP